MKFYGHNIRGNPPALCIGPDVKTMSQFFHRQLKLDKFNYIFHLPLR